MFELESSLTALVDLLDELFDFCERQIHWRNQWSELNDIKRAIEKEGYEVRDLVTLSEEKWLAMGLGNGYLRRI